MQEMISFINGTLREKGENKLVIEVGGIGFELSAPVMVLDKLPPLGKSARLYTYLHVRDDCLQLYGFSSPPQRDLFLKLISVSGIGPKVALSVLSVYTPEVFARMVDERDAEALTMIPGIGKKGASRLILEMREKIELGADEEWSGLPSGAREALKEARAALTNLGYTQAEAQRALRGWKYGEEDKVEDLLKYALRGLAGKKE